MGSCYSTKSNQMPHTTQSNQPSPALKRSPNQAQTTNTLNNKNATSEKTTSTAGGAFGFQKPYGGRYGSAKQNGDMGGGGKEPGGKGDLAKTSASKGCSTRIINGQASPVRARFGFRKPSTGVSAKVSDSSRTKSSSESLQSSASGGGKDVQKRTVSSRSTGVKTSYVPKISSSKSVSAKSIPMIDDVDSSGPTDGIGRRVNTSGDYETTVDNSKPNGNVEATSEQQLHQKVQEDRINANTPQTKHGTSGPNANIYTDNRGTGKPAGDEVPQNSNIRNHSKYSKSSTTTKQANTNTSGLKAPSKLARTFAKSKSEQAVKTEKLISDNRGKTSSRGKENVSVTSQRLVVTAQRPVSATPTSRSNFGRKDGFLKKTFSKRKNVPEHSSQTHNSVISPKNVTKNSPPVRIAYGTVTAVNGDSAELKSETSAKQTVPVLNSGLESGTQDTSEKTLVGIGVEVAHLQFSPDTNGPEKVHAAVPPSVKKRLERTTFPTGKAPIANADHVEISSLGSIGSDDLMLETEIDLGDYDEEYAGDTTHGSCKSGGAIRNRSRSGSGRFGSRSRSFEKNKSQSCGDKHTPEVHVSGQMKTGFKSEGVRFESKVQNFNESKDDDGVFESPHQGQVDVNGEGSDANFRRETWRAKRSSTCESDADSEAVGELHHLMDLHNGPVPRRFPRIEKANRPASFPGFNKQVPDPSSESGHLVSGSIFRRPRTSSIGDDERITIDATTYRQMTQECTVFKTMLFKLKRVIQDDELASPLTTGAWKNGWAFNSSQPNSPLRSEIKQDTNYSESLIKENEDLRHQVLMMKHQLEEQERTITLLQQQMTKYECGQFGSEGKGSAHSSTQTDKPSGITISKKNTTQLLQKLDKASNKNMPLLDRSAPHPVKSTAHVKKAFSETRSQSLGTYRPGIRKDKPS